MNIYIKTLLIILLSLVFGAVGGFGAFVYLQGNQKSVVGQNQIDNKVPGAENQNVAAETPVKAHLSGRVLEVNSGRKEIKIASDTNGQKKNFILKIDNQVKIVTSEGKIVDFAYLKVDQSLLIIAEGKYADLGEVVKPEQIEIIEMKVLQK